MQLWDNPPLQTLPSSNSCLSPPCLVDFSSTCELAEPLVLVCSVASAVSDSLQPYGLEPTRFCCAWDPSNKNTRVGFPALLQSTGKLTRRFLTWAPDITFLIIYLLQVPVSGSPLLGTQISWCPVSISLIRKTRNSSERYPVKTECKRERDTIVEASEASQRTGASLHKEKPVWSREMLSNHVFLCKPWNEIFSNC